MFCWEKMTSASPYASNNQPSLSQQSTANATVVAAAEILKNNGLAVEKSKTLYSTSFIVARFAVLEALEIMTSTIDMRDDSRGRPVQKAKIEIVLGKTDDFDNLMVAAAEERAAVDNKELN